MHGHADWTVVLKMRVPWCALQGVMEPLGAASSGTTTDVATFLKIVRDATTTTPVTLDLGGHTISFEGRVREERLYIDRSFVTITNGTLLLPDMTVLVLRGQGIKLDRLTIKGPGSSEMSSMHACAACLGAAMQAHACMQLSSCWTKLRCMCNVVRILSMQG